MHMQIKNINPLFTNVQCDISLITNPRVQYDLCETLGLDLANLNPKALETVYAMCSKLLSAAGGHLSWRCVYGSAGDLGVT